MNIWVLLLALLLTGVARSQTITGKLLDLVDNKSLRGAWLALRSVQDSTSRFGALSGRTGRVRFSNIPLDSFSFKVSFICYENYKQFISLTDSIPNVSLGTLFIPKSTKELGGVTVTARTPP